MAAMSSSEDHTYPWAALLSHSVILGGKAEIRLLMLSQLKQLDIAVNATRSFQDDEDYMNCIEDIIEVFPSLKVEEVLICFKHIRQGKYDLYGTLCTGSIIKSSKRRKAT